MDQSLFNIIVGVCGTLGGWVLKTIWESVRDLQIADKSLADKVFSIEILVAGTYVKRMDFDNLSNALCSKLDRIENKLDGKVDK